MKTYIANVQVENLKRFWTKIAKEAIHMGYAPGVIYGYCSELGILKILNEYRFSEKAQIGYSQKYSSLVFKIRNNHLLKKKAGTDTVPAFFYAR